MLSFNLHWSIGQAALDVAFGYVVFFMLALAYKYARRAMYRFERARDDRAELERRRKTDQDRMEAQWERERRATARRRKSVNAKRRGRR